MGAMDFFGHQQRARTASKWLVLLFLAAVLAIIALIYVVAILTLTYSDVRAEPWQPDVLLGVTVGVVAVVVVAMLFKTGQLSQGGGKVATMLGGRRVTPDTTDLQERTLHNVVEEMAIASSIPVPEVYVLDREQGLNAFAAGWGTKDAAVAVTRGLLDELDRDELQGVIAHEFSHVFHGDMRLNIRLMGVLFGIVCIATIGRIVVYAVGRGGSGNRKGGAGGIIVFGIALIAIGWIGVFFARMIQAAVSRQREFLADSSAVQYTRNPRGIGMALAKIGGLGSRLENAHTEEASHFLFADGMKRMIGGAFATHPPIEERVARILPGFTSEVKKTGSMTAAVSALAPPPPAGTSGFAGGGAGPSVPVAGTGRRGTVGARDIVRHIGDPQPEHVAAARALLDQLPLDLVAAAHDSSRAHPLALAMFLEREPRRRDAQLGKMRNRAGRDLQQAQMFASTLARQPTNAVLALLEMAIPTLRSLGGEDRERLRADARALAMADESLTPFEFALLKTLEQHVPGQGPATMQPSGRTRSLASHAQETAVVLSVLARVGAGGDESAAAAAFTRGVAALATGSGPQLLPAGKCSITALERSLDALDRVSPLGKRNLLTACVAAAGADDIVTAGEADLLRALAQIWGCPIPLVAGPAGAADS